MFCHRDTRLAFLASAALSVAFLPLASSSARAEWPENGAPVCEEVANQLNQVILETSDGGAILAWSDGRSGPNDIYAQRIDAWGRPLWTPGGVAICTADSSQSQPQITTDQAGGAIITWYDRRNGNYDVYAQRVDQEGVPLWSTDGVPVVVTSGDQTQPQIASDGAGGAIIAWTDDRGSDRDLYAQKLDESGAAQWTTNGIGVSTASYAQIVSKIISDQEGGAIIGWFDYRNDVTVPDVYAQHIDSSGADLWTAGGVAVCVQPGVQFLRSIVFDGVGGGVFTWDDYRGADLDIYSQYISASGVPQWTANGVLVCGASGTQQEPVSIASADGVIIAWRDDRNAVWDVYAQRLSMSGVAQWTADGMFIARGAIDHYGLEVAEDELGGAIFTWVGDQLGTRDIYVIRISAAGEFVWSVEAIPLSIAPGDQSNPEMVTDGEGGAIVCWLDERAGSYDVYAQRVTRQGYWGLPSANISSVTDVPGDQGGQVWIEFDASRFDTWMEDGIDYYSVWRNISTTGAIGLTAESGVVGIELVEIPGPAQAQRDLAGDAYFFASGTAWQLIGTVDAHYLSEYGYLAETARDSTSLDPAVEQYFVSAHATSGVDWWDSAPAEGYSVDNLAPCIPGGAAAEITGWADLWIHWNPNYEDDLHHYAVYRGTSAGFLPDETSRLGTTTDTSFVDSGYSPGESYYYKISAWDVHDNESQFALITPDMITGVPGSGPPRANALFQNTPNPFVTTTRIVFSMKDAGHVRLMVFDAKGRLMRVLVDEIRQPDNYVESWDGRDGNGRQMPGGTYFFSLEAPGWNASKKMTLAR